ncbi:hypothetical protein [Roseiconus lacunae]|uniref:hypothetical protein n=1 Tax=Roseiconus lacunae TaxID=2605694 RepID=UPI0011F264B1|nr:hypothetical protein [Roseiconus lacunae]
MDSESTKAMAELLRSIRSQPSSSHVTREPVAMRLVWPIAFVVVAISAIIMLPGRSIGPQPGPEPGPEPTPVVADVAELTESLCAKYMAAMAEGQTYLAEEVAAGRVANQEQYFAMSKALSTAARKDAFMPLSDHENVAMPHNPMGDWDASQRETVVRHTQQVAEGFRRASQ